MIQKKTTQTNGSRPASSRNNTERKQAEEALQASEATYREIFNAVNEGILVLKMETGEILDANATFCNLFGHTPQEVRQLRVEDVSSGEAPYIQEDALRLIRKAAKGPPQRFEWRAKSRDGRLFWIDVALKRATIAGQDCVLAIGRDITERKQAEEALKDAKEFSEGLLAAMQDGLSVLDAHGVPVHVNPAFCKMTGFSREEIVGVAPPRPYWPPEEMEEIERALQKFLSGQPQDLELTFMRKNGQRFPAIVSPSYTRDPQGNVVHCFATFKDITERKRAEETLRRSEATYREIFNAANEAIVVHDIETGEIVDANAAFCDVFGYTPEEARRHKVGTLSSGEAPYTQEDALRWIHKAARGEPQRYEWLAKDRDGRLLWMDVTLRRATIAGQDRVLAIGHDITERKRAEEALRETTQTLQALIQASPLAILTMDLQGNVRTWNPAAERIFGWSEQEALGRPNPIIPEDRQNEFPALLDAVLQGNLFSKAETRRRRKDGSLIDVSLSTAAMRNATGDIIGVMSMLDDITERKQAEETLRESESRYRLLAKNVTDVIWTADLDLNFTYISPSSQLLGHAPEQPMPQRVEEVLTPASLEIAMKALAEELATENIDEKDLSRSRTLELESYRRDGSTVWVEDRMTFLRDPDGRPVGILGVSRDITERKQAEETLRETRDYLEKLIDYANAPIIVWDPNFTITRFNHAFERLTGRPAGEVLGQRLEVLFPEAERAASMEQIARTLRGEFWELIEISILHQSGEVWRVLWNSANIAGPDGRTVVATIAQGTDITERKQAEETLRESEQRFRTLSEASFEAIAIHRKGRMLEANQPLATMFGYELSEVIGMHVLDFVAPESRDAVLQSIVSKSREPFEFTGLRKDGTTFPVEVCGRPIPYQGKMVTVAALRDITEHKQAEEALQKAREELEARVEREMERGNPYGLTFRELTVLHVVAAGKADKEIGGQLGITTLTASKHLANILSKMGAASRTDACVRALREGLLD